MRQNSMQVAPMRLFICRASARASPSILSSSSSVMSTERPPQLMPATRRLAELNT